MAKSLRVKIFFIIQAVMHRLILFIVFLFFILSFNVRAQGVIEVIKNSHLFETKKGNGCKVGTSYKKKRKSLVHINTSKKSKAPYQYVYRSANAAPPKSTSQPTAPSDNLVAKKEPKNDATTATVGSPTNASTSQENKVVDTKKITPPKKNILTDMNPEERKKAIRDLPPSRELAPIRFISDQDEFSVVNMDSFMEALELVNQGKMVLIEGHTDDLGSDDYNLKLSMKRVEKIRQLMLDAGGNDSFISVIGYGEKKPLVPNTSTANREINRRIEFKIFDLE